MMELDRTSGEKRVCKRVGVRDMPEQGPEDAAGRDPTKTTPSAPEAGVTATASASSQTVPGPAAAAGPRCAGAEAQVMQGDVVQSGSRSEKLGWVCCITPENDEGHVYWQPHGDASATDTREPLGSLRCVDRALIPGDIVRRCDAGGAGDVMGMVVGTEVLLDLCDAERKDVAVGRGVPARDLRHLVPIRLATWVVHQADGWLGRVQSWDEDVVVRFPDTTDGNGTDGACRCRVRAANQKQGIAIVESFYRDFFPGLGVSVSLQELRSGALDCEWLAGDVSRVTCAAEVAGSFAEEGARSGNSPQRAEAVVEAVCVGAARVEWLAQVPLWRGWSTERPPRCDGCHEDKLHFLLGEAESSSRWALGDRTRVDGVLAEVRSVRTYVDVRWQDGALTPRVPSRELQLCNPDAFSFFPSELVCQRSFDESQGGGAGGVGPFAARCGTPGTSTPTLLRHGETSRGTSADGGNSERIRRDEPPRIGHVARADPASRMVIVRWLDDNSGGKEEEWSAFDLQIDPEFGYRLGDAVIRCRDWEEGGNDAKYCGPRVGQVVGLELGTVRVRWLDGTVSPHGPRELYRVGDEDEGSVADSQDGSGAAHAEAAEVIPVHGGGSMAAAAALVTTAARALAHDAHGGGALGSSAGGAPHGAPGGGGDGAGGEEEPSDAGHAETVDAVGADGGGAAEPSAAPGASGAGPAEGGAPGTAAEPTDAAPSAAEPSAELEPLPAESTVEPAEADANAGDTGAGELSFEDMAWEPLPSDHHFVHCAHPPGPANRQFSRRVQREWTILRRGVPRGVWVHIYPDRMELLRACLVGPEGTPYSDALFFFDVHLPPAYPQIPPQVRFWSFGESLNPNLYENGKVCLSLLGTWSGKDSETWCPERSNLLQVLVSILGLVLNTEPYYNEPGFERERDTPQGGLRSQRYNESVALSSYHLMLRVLRAPPGDFDGAVKRHFAERRPTILARARAFQEGDEAVCSEGFRKSLAALVPRLEEALPEAPP